LEKINIILIIFQFIISPKKSQQLLIFFKEFCDMW
jgi:hypothetical protein